MPDVGCLSVYVLLLLVVEQNCLDQQPSMVKSDGKYKQRYIKKEKAAPERYHVAAKGEGCKNLASKPQLSGDTQIKRNGLI